MVDDGTDQMRVVRQRVVVPDARNVPKLHPENGSYSPAEFIDEVAWGFERAYEVMSRRKDEILAHDGPLEAFRDDETRHVIRGTQTYFDRLREGSHPDLLRDALDLSQFLDGLRHGFENSEAMPDICVCEHADLLAQDIPYFGTAADSTDLRHHCGKVFRHASRRSGFALAREKVTRLGEADLRRQRWLITASGTALTLGDGSSRWPTFDLVVHEQSARVDDLLEAASRVGDRVARLALVAEGDTAWLGVDLVEERTWSLRPANLDLYSGLPGIALFLGYLSAISGEDSYRMLAKGAVATTLRLWDQQTQRRAGEEHDLARQVAAGGFTDLGGSLYALCHLGTLWNDDRLLEYANRLAVLLPAAITNDTSYDVIAGAAGGIAVLRSVHACTGAPEALDAAVAAGEHLLSASVDTGRGAGWPAAHPRRRPLLGFSHGAAGIGWALVELAAMCRSLRGDEALASRYESTARQAFDHERSQYSEQHRNWPDLRADHATGGRPPAIGGQDFMTAWCQGAPGIGLSRLQVTSRIDDPVMAGEIDTALDTTLRTGMGMNHSLCHGTPGNLELPLAYALRRNDASMERRVYQIAQAVLDSIAEVGWLTGIPKGVETPGLMTGLSGIGYALLRLAAPERVPSVLTLDVPPRHNHAYPGLATGS